MKKSDLVAGFRYKIKCGWGWTNAKFLYDYRGINGKTTYLWETPKGFRFISYDLEDTIEL